MEDSEEHKEEHKEEKEKKHEEEHPKEEKHKEHGEKKARIEKPKKPKKIKIEKYLKANSWKIASAVLGLLLILSLFTYGFRFKCGASGGALTEQEAADKAVKYINENLLQTGEASLTSVEDIGDLYKIKLDISGSKYDSYITKSGDLLFPSAVDLNEEVEEVEEPEVPEPPAVVKSDKPQVELFVMSHCPYGTQAEKGIIPVVELLGDKIDFEVKYVNYAMHGDKEVYEQLNQHCIKTDQEDKFLPYLKCFLGDGDSEKCLSEAGIDIENLEACADRVDKEFKVTENFEDKSSWSGGSFPLFLINDEENKEYGVRGSPTLIINGQSVSSARSPAAYLATICNAFTEAPEECDEELSSTTPGPGFGYTDASSNTGGSCS